MSFISSASQSVTERLKESDTDLEAIPAYQVAFSLWTFYYPIIFVFGTFGNVMTIVIMRKMMSGESTVNIFFIAIATGDLLVLYTGPMKHWIEHTFKFYFLDTKPVIHYVLFWIASCSGAIVSWLLVCVTLQRALSVVWPHHVNTICTRRRVVITMIGTIVFLFSLYFHYLYCVPVVIFSAESDVDCLSMASSSTYVWFLDNVFTYVDLLVFSLLPFVCLVLGNTVLAVRLIKSMRQARRNLTVRTSVQADKREKETYSVTVTVFVVSITFVVFTLPICVYFVLFQFKDLSSMSNQETANVYLFFTISFMMSDTNSAVNFYLYCLTGRRFRELFVKTMSWRTLKVSSVHT